MPAKARGRGLRRRSRPMCVLASRRLPDARAYHLLGPHESPTMSAKTREDAMTRRPTIAAFGAAVFSLTGGNASAQPAPFTVGAVTAAPGTTASGAIAIAARPGDQGTTIPISIVHGVKPGPVLALTAGVHGQEYAPVIALQRVLKSLDPKSIAGTVVLVHVANMPSYLARTIYYAPADGKNLNRVFPGRADGTLSERIAF